MPSCRSCGGGRLEVFLSLGDLPLADALLRDSTEPEARFPLDIAFCPDCALVQILEEVPPQRLFVDNYLYFSSFSDALLEHARVHAAGLVNGLGPESLVVEVGSNDGYLLRHVAAAGVPVLGIDPAPDQADAADAAGVPTLREFFGLDLARRLRAEGRRADVIVANNVMAHTPDLNGFVGGLAELLADDGVATIENPSVEELVERCEFDTIYHEHFSYLSSTSVAALMARHGLVLFRVEAFPDLHGGTRRWWVSRSRPVEASARDALVHEGEAGVGSAAFYRSFAGRVEAVRRELIGMVGGLRAEGARVAAYGAAAKGATLLNSCGLGTDMVEFVVDRNPHKQGRFMPGTHQPIRPPEALVEEQPDAVLLLAWNFAREVMAQQQAYRDAGGRFLVPIPQPALV
ncbi:MAG TPA: class I SAM-dependent methyltransferase [Gaiellaceae bacterium]|nr:class I SAM-dependent methyltransferase [Gaiellaceae bacterium]